MPANTLNPLPTKTITVTDDEKVGLILRAKRERAKMSLRTVAAKLGFSAAYVSDLERGKRAWTDAKVADYLAAL